MVKDFFCKKSVYIHIEFGYNYHIRKINRKRRSNIMIKVNGIMLKLQTSYRTVYSTKLVINF